MIRNWLKKYHVSEAASLPEKYDYVIIGGGSAGCVLASRLSERDDISVLLLEAGKRDTSPFINLPFGWAAIAYHKSFSWMHETTPGKHLGDRTMHWPRGKVLGGSSSINGMIYIRGKASDYDHWQSLGNQGWSWKHVLPYFKRSEDHFLGETEFHGVGGPVHITRAEGDVLGDTFIKGCVQIGMPEISDFNAGDPSGVGYYDVNIKQGKRQSASKTFLKNAEGRANLTVLTEALVEKIVFDDDGASKVQFVRDGKQRQIGVNNEVILSAGVIGSPQILQLSGIGPADLLAKHGVELVKHMPGVGENLQDHLGVMVAHQIIPPITLKTQLKPHRFFYHLYQYWRHKRGLLNTTAGYVGAFLKSSPELNEPNMQLHFSPASGYRTEAGISVIDKQYGATTVLTSTNPESRGSIRISSSNPNDQPDIDANYLATDKDRADVIQAIRIQREMFASPAMNDICGEEIRPGSHIQSDQDLLDYIKEFCVTNYHPVGTCKMGQDEQAVVDSELRVIGMSKLRVVDASIMPTLISGNTNATSMMIAEKAADLILAERD